MLLRSIRQGLVCAFLFAFSGSSSSAQEKMIRFNVGVEPKTLDPHLITGVPESHVLNTLIEGLVLLDEKGKALPGIAERWEVSPDGKTYTFHLRDAKWSNREPVTADDFVFGWRRCLAPATAAEYAYQLYLIKGAEEYNTGKSKDPSTVAAKAVDQKTLQVELKNPTPYFTAVLAHAAFSPLKESWIKANPQWSTQPDKYLCNGPFVFDTWRHSDRIIVKKNPHYYNADKVRLDGVEMFMITNESTALLQWEAGKLDIIETNVPLPDIPRLKKQGKLQVEPYLGVYYVAVQNEKKPFDDVRVRKALSLAVNRQQITDAILRSGQPPARAFIPPGITLENGKDYRVSSGDLFKEDIAEAKRLLKEAGYPNGRGLPRIRYLYNDVQMHRTIGEALQRMWLENIGVKVDLQVQEWKVYIQNLHAENFQIARAGWIGDYVDPLAFLDMFQTGAGNNNFKYSNPKFDALVAESRATTDTAKRLENFRAAEKILIADDMAVIPLYFYVNPVLQQPYVKGVRRNPTSSVYFHQAYIEK